MVRAKARALQTSSADVVVTLRPALFDLWPSPWPEECREHAWQWLYVWFGSFESHWQCYHCSHLATGTNKSELPTAGTLNPARNSR